MKWFPKRKFVSISTKMESILRWTGHQYHLSIFGDNESNMVMTKFYNWTGILCILYIIKLVFSFNLHQIEIQKHILGYSFRNYRPKIHKRNFMLCYCFSYISGNVFLFFWRKIGRIISTSSQFCTCWVKINTVIVQGTGELLYKIVVHYKLKSFYL